MNKMIFGTDPHGNKLAYENLFKLAEQQGLDVVLGGDLTPKLLAIRLADYEDEKSGKVKTGGIVPMPMLRKKGEYQNYTASLKRIQRLNRNKNPKEIEKRLRETGYLIHTLESRTYNLEEMCDESSVIDKLCDIFSRNYPAQRAMHPFELTDDEKIALEIIVDNIREIEEKYNSSKKDGLANTWRTRIGLPERKDLSFCNLAISTNLQNYLRLKEKDRLVEEQFEALKGAVASKDRELADFCNEELKRIYEKARLAVQLGGAAYDINDFKILPAYSLAERLVKEFSRTEIFIEGQKNFIERYLRRRLQKLKIDSPKTRVFLIAGNDDRREIEDSLKSLDSDGLVKYLNNEVTDLGEGLFIAGYPFVKDSGGRFYAGWEKPEDQIFAELRQLATKSDPKRTIYVIHSPPLRTSLDIACTGEHVGSDGVKEFIEVEQPYATLHGHIHESPLISKKYSETIGRTVSMNPGGLLEYRKNNFRAIILDPSNLESLELAPKE